MNKFIMIALVMLLAGCSGESVAADKNEWHRYTCDNHFVTPWQSDKEDVWQKDNGYIGWWQKTDYSGDSRNLHFYIVPGGTVCNYDKRVGSKPRY